MDEQEIDVIGLEIFKRLLEARREVPPHEVVVFYFGGDEEFGARDAALFERPAEEGFVGVGLGRIEMAVAGGEGLVYGIDAGLAVFDLPQAEADFGDLGAV